MGLESAFGDEWWGYVTNERTEMAKQKLNAAERMLAAKKRLVKRLKDDIADVREQAGYDIAKIEKRINIAQTIADAIENGTLKP